MENLENQVNNGNNNGNQRRDTGGEHVRVLQAGNNRRVVIAENLSSKKEEPYEEEIVDHGNQHNHDYRVKVDILLFNEIMGAEEFLD